MLVPVDGSTLVLPVWIPQHVVSPGEPGSADDMVATFFRWKRIPLFRNDSEQCSVHQHKQNQDHGYDHRDTLTIMGQSCLSRVYISTHNGT